MNEDRLGLYDPARESSACGVGFITRKDGTQHHDVILRGEEALCAIPHRGGMSAEGVGDGAGVSVDLSVEFFSHLAGRDLERGRFGVANLFLPTDPGQGLAARELVRLVLAEHGFEVLVERDVPVDPTAIRPAAAEYQLPIVQWVFAAAPDASGEAGDRTAVDRAANAALLDIEREAYGNPALSGLYPLSLSARTMVLKGRLNAGEVVRYFTDLSDPRHSVATMYFHTRFSTNTEPHPTMAQPFRMMAHNGELNTDRKNRLSDDALARSRSRTIVRPPGQSDSSRLDQTLQSRVFDDGLGLVEAVVSLMPPAWENDASLPQPVRDMLEFFSLYEEKNDGPAALIFSDGDVVGARLDRLGLRPLRSVETDEYLVVASEAGQVAFPDDEVTHRGRIEAGGMLYLDHRTGDGRVYRTREALEKLAAQRDYAGLLEFARVRLADLSPPEILRGVDTLGYPGDLTLHGRYVSYSLNQESFRFLLDPMLADGSERISAMGYGNAINALSDQEGGMAKYFSQRFAQVTNPPLDSIREADAMSMRVALGAKTSDGSLGKSEAGGLSKQIVLESPILGHLDMIKLRRQTITPLRHFELLYTPVPDDAAANAEAVLAAVDRLCDEVEAFARRQGGIAVLTDRPVATDEAPVPLLLAIAAVDQRLISAGVRLRVSIVAESGQLPSSHHIASALGFGASAVYSLSARLRAEEKYPSPAAPAGEYTDTDRAFDRFRKAAEKSLAKTMGRVGLCTVESYIGGQFFEPNYLDTRDPVLARCFPHLDAPVGGVGFARIAQAATEWHARAATVENENQIPLLGLFKERSDGAGHSYGISAVRGFAGMTEEPTAITPATAPAAEGDALRLLTLSRLEDSFGITDDAYRHNGFGALTAEQIDSFEMTAGYREFLAATTLERSRRPSALRDVLVPPADVTMLSTEEEFARELGRFSLDGNGSLMARGLLVERLSDNRFRVRLTEAPEDPALEDEAYSGFAAFLEAAFPGETEHFLGEGLTVTAHGRARGYLGLLDTAPPSLPLDEVQPAHEITRALASGAMSHGALVASAHEAVAHGTNMVGGMSNCGEGGEHRSRYGTIRGSRIKQFASGRFGIWAGYLADPMLEELEIKIGQGAKPGEGGQLPAPKVTVDIAAARGGTPGIELISPPPHHDTYSIEDLAQLIHDCKAARVRVIVKLVSSEGIGTIAVGVAKAGADVINVAGNTGGTGAAAVTSLKYAGRSAEIGIAEVHQALVANGLRDKVILRCSGAHQTGGDVVVSALLGGDSFEFGTTALMMLKCVMAKNCNIKCPAGLTTNPEVFDGDPRALAQYLMNVAHHVRQILARLGLRSLRDARGRTDLLQLLEHPSAVGHLDVRGMLARVPGRTIADPVYLEKDYSVDDGLLARVRDELFVAGAPSVTISGVALSNPNKSVGGQLSIDIERLLNHPDADTRGAFPAGCVPEDHPAVLADGRGRRFLSEGAVRVESHGTAGQSFGVFTGDGVELVHTGTANDGVSKSQSGGRVIVRSPGGGATGAGGRAVVPGGNVLIGNFALFGATGGRTFVQGEAGDRFAVRNSGATAVVEGVGEYCCEYMTGGAVLNLGRYGKGLGNGMSGGFVYQYDPEQRLAQTASDALLVHPLVGEDVPAFHEEAAQTMLRWHVEASGSPLGAALLDDWATAREHIVVGMPRAMLLYQDADAILAAKPRKDLLDELATAVAGHRLHEFKTALRDGLPIADGVTPALGDTTSDHAFALLSSFTVLALSREVAAERVPGAIGPNDPRLIGIAQNLLLTEDFAVRARLLKYLRPQLERYDDRELAAQIAAKRLEDYTTSLTERNVLGIDAPGTYGWILHQRTKNASVLDHRAMDSMLVDAAVKDMARFVKAVSA
ncbi:glutamate synthase-related protein [Tsukamurella sp. 8F]|uniref:glutamate synthase-related protein n=1 Tax=unclassified Tsukamurella TaxID=2633480 RepID=UPI0023B8FF98|nr:MULTISPECIES: glutamate synthase-related protein [unclassified Tsukamurella]MDF0530613.1 glutamate synthase-related protein [Tsukamurella sp. 8J]MDF0587814.1 glutamate synthase-related protein [Tsukamurella sp. 8F]